MNTLLHVIKNFIIDESGSHAAEYVTVTAVSVGGLVGSIKTVKDTGATKFNDIADTINNTPSEGG